MARFEKSNERRGRNSSGRGFNGRSGFGPKRGDRRSSRSGDRNSEKTKVICSSCGIECEVPFKPSSSKPVYCDACFDKKNKEENFKVSEKDVKEIKDKLNKIMKALKIE